MLKPDSGKEEALSNLTPLDGTDARILLALDRDPQATVVALAADTGLARNTVQARLRRMTESGALGRESRRIDPAALGYPLLALVTVSISQRMRVQATEALSALPEVLELLATTGDGDLLARVVARDTADLNRITEMLVDMPGIVRTSTAIVLKEVRPLRLDGLLERLATNAASR
ncbi:Lrp/AsnC family transcriptional regulator [Kineosporia succinea]|uniref:DNA-binding Lrp family transcriptional regulator n=1 Tax=Kineosporia succinea TaxID=84632 RepID=A0ABT9P9J8_9ACTN|nr:Lrp/AsnC family transcriptional regulator [Kineosporia succinea]MDP9828840.1 DNA-binding Lrp family transcriptional regulator [Kineosporia succinea]